MNELPLDPTMRVLLKKDKREYRFEIHPSNKFAAWPFWIDDEQGPRFGVIESPERVLELKATLEARIRGLEADGWIKS